MTEIQNLEICSESKSVVKSTSKNLSEILSNNDKHFWFFFVFKTNCELKCQNEVFFYIIRFVCFDYWEFLMNFLTYFYDTIWHRTKLQLIILFPPKKGGGLNTMSIDCSFIWRLQGKSFLKDVWLFAFHSNNLKKILL